MSLTLLLPTMPAAGPLPGGWSRWDIGCCCDSDMLCDCVIVDNYVDDFSSGTLDSGWDAISSSLVDVDGGLLKLSGVAVAADDLRRCLILPEMLGNMVVLEFTCVTTYAFTTRIQPVIRMLDESCNIHHTAGLEIFVNLLATIYKKPATEVIYTDPVEDTVCRIEVELTDDTPYTYESRWYVDGVLKDTETATADSSEAPSVAVLAWQWSTRTDLGQVIELDDMTFSVEPA